MFVMKGGSMGRPHIGPIQTHPDRRSFLILTARTSVQRTDWLSLFPAGWATEVHPPNFLHSKSLHNACHLEKFLAIFDGFFYLEISGGEISLAHPLVNSYSCHARVLNWAIRDNIRQVEQAQNEKNPKFGQLYLSYIFPYCPVEDSDVAALKIH